MSRIKQCGRSTRLSRWWARLTSRTMDPATTAPVPPSPTSLVPPSTSSTPSVCENCQKLQIDIENNPSKYCCVEVDADVLGESDCEVCRILWNSFGHCFPNYPYHSSTRLGIFAENRQLCILPYPPHEKIEEIQRKYKLRGIILYRCPDIPCPWSIFPAPEITSIEVLTSGSIDRARHWMNQCERHHTCLNSVDGKLPSRLLHLGETNSEIRLITTTVDRSGKHSVGPTGSDHGDVDKDACKDACKYACLSHCWGDPELMKGFKTTRGNYSARLHSIAWTQIPRTFQDAIEVTRALGIGFIWIDSMCIIQDDEADWNTESANMRSIYENSYITIGATSSTGPNGGLYLQESSDSFQESGTTSSGNYFSVIARGIPYHPDDRWGSTRGRVYQWPLMDRAWALQERLLSPRFLHFTCHEMIWECKTDMSCECGSNEVKYLSMKQTFHDDFLNHKGEVEAWHNIVTSYSRLHLTKESDKLPALSGLAAKIAARRPGSHYYAGLWSDSIDQDLLWQVSPLEESLPDCRAAKWRAPTWSWASLDSRVEFPPGGEVTRLCQIIDVETSPATEDEWGRVTKGSLLTISGQLFPATIEGEDYDLILEGRRVVSLRKFSEDKDIALFLDSERDKSFSKDNIVFCLRIARVRYDSYYISEYTLLLRFDDNSKRYERIGIISQEFEVSSEPLSDSLFSQGGEVKTVEIV